MCLSLLAAMTSREALYLPVKGKGNSINIFNP